MSLREVRFTVALPDETAEGGLAAASLSGVISYDLFRDEPHTVVQATAVFDRNRDSVLAAFLRALRQARTFRAKPGTDRLVITLVAADLPQGLIA